MNREDAKDAKIFFEGGDRVLDELAYVVFGAALEVHRLLGPGYLESVYQEALGVELTARCVPFARQVPIGIDYKGYRVGQTRLDFLVDQRVVVEIKAVDVLAKVHTAQVLSYLKATRCRLGLLINFNVPILRSGMKRVVLTR